MDVGRDRHRTIYRPGGHDRGAHLKSGDEERRPAAPDLRHGAWGGNPQRPRLGLRGLAACRFCCCVLVRGLHQGSRLGLLRLGHRGPVDPGAKTGLMRLWPGRGPYLPRLGRRGPVDLRLASGLEADGVGVVLVLADGDTHQEGSSCDHCGRGNVGGDSKPTTAFFRLPRARSGHVSLVPTIK